MNEPISQNTKAILLLTAPLIVGRRERSAELLTPGEYKKLALRLRELGAQPSDLLTPSAPQLLENCARVIDKARLGHLLTRGFALSQAVEHWQARAIWVMSRADAAYPQRLKKRLKEDSPPVLYGCGERSLLDSGGLAVVGSRHVDEALVAYTERVGLVVAHAGRTLVSGGARGIDQAAMHAALKAGGPVTGVMADSLERAAMSREHRNPLLKGQLVLISPYDPRAGFQVGHAMQRNKLIYALSDAALVVSADANKGGTWAGATEQLDKLRLVPVYVRSGGTVSSGLEALKKKGALSWPDPQHAQDLEAILAVPAPDGCGTSPQQSQLSFAPVEEQAARQVHPADSSDSQLSKVRAASPAQQGSSLAEDLFKAVQPLVLRVLQEPMKAAEVARRLEVSEPQARKWLQRLVEEGVLEKTNKPVRYSIRQTSPPEPETPSGSDPQTLSWGARK